MPERWDKGITGATLRIATTDHSPLRVRAGPGTGKTFALMRRVARLLQTGSDPRKVFVSTFTRTAASDLEKELKKQGNQGANNVVAGTLHSFCFRLLSQNEVLNLTGRVPRPLLEHEVRFLLEDIQEENFGNFYERKRRLEAFNADWARLQSEIPGWPIEPVDREFHKKLIEWLSFHRALLIGELVPLVPCPT